jgi:hypothetical protein
MVGLLASPGTPRWETVYGNYLRDSTSFSQVTWKNDFHWDQVGGAKDFNLSAFTPRVDDDDDDDDEDVRPRLGRKDHLLTQVDVKRAQKFTPDANLGVEKLPPTAGLTVPNPVEEAVAEERAQTLVQLEESPAVSESAVADHANPSPAAPPASMPEFIVRLRDSESPVEGNRGCGIEDPPSAHPHGDQRQDRSDERSPEAARPDLLVEDREFRRKVPEARRRQEAKQRVENASRAAEEFENDFTQTRSGDDLFNNDDEDGSLAAPENGHSAARERPKAPSTLQPPKAERKKFARLARKGPYRRPIGRGQDDQNRPLTQINMQVAAPDQITMPPEEDRPLPAIPPIEQAPIAEAPNTLPAPQSNDRNVDRGRKAAHRIQQQRPPAVASPHEPSQNPVIFWTWTGTRWKEETRVVADQSDPLRVEREAKRFVKAHHAQLRDARMGILMPKQCLSSARQDGSHSVFLIFEDQTITDAMEKAAALFMHSRHHRP